MENRKHFVGTLQITLSYNKICSWQSNMKACSGIFTMTRKHQHLYLTCRKAFRQILKKMCGDHVDLTSETEESARFYKQS